MEPISTDPESLGGVPGFTGNRVPVASLIEYLKAGDTVDDFLVQFPTVTREQVLAVVDAAALNLPANQIRRVAG